MNFLSLLLLFCGSLSGQPPWSELTLSIERADGYSSDQVAICRVRVVNHGSHTYPGRSLHFEARAVDGGVVVERARGRFGLSLPPGGTLETLISFSAPYTRFEVAPAAASGESGGRSRAKGKRSKPSSHKPRR
jgi:hypothetical protein